VPLPHKASGRKNQTLKLIQQNNPNMSDERLDNIIAFYQGKEVTAGDKRVTWKKVYEAIVSKKEALNEIEKDIEILKIIFIDMKYIKVDSFVSKINTDEQMSTRMYYLVMAIMERICLVIANPGNGTFSDPIDDAYSRGTLESLLGKLRTNMAASDSDDWPSIRLLDFSLRNLAVIGCIDHVIQFWNRLHVAYNKDVSRKFHLKTEAFDMIKKSVIYLVENFQTCEIISETESKDNITNTVTKPNWLKDMGDRLPQRNPITTSSFGEDAVIPCCHHGLIAGMGRESAAEVKMHFKCLLKLSPTTRNACLFNKPVNVS